MSQHRPFLQGVMSPAPSPVFYNPPDTPEPPSWSSTFAQQVNAGLRGLGSGNSTAPAAHIRIAGNVDIASQRPVRLDEKRRLPTMKCLIAIFLAVVLVTGALVGAMVAIAKKSKARERLDTLSVNGGSMSTTPQPSSRTTSQSTPWSTTTAVSKSLPAEESATSTLKGPTARSKSLHEGSSSFSSFVEITHRSSAALSTTTTKNTPESPATSSTTVSYDLSTASTVTPTQKALTSTLEGFTTILIESTMAHTPSTTDHETITTVPLSYDTSLMWRTPAAVRPSPTRQFHDPAAHSRPDNEEVRDLQRPGHTRNQDQDA